MTEIPNLLPKEEINRYKFRSISHSPGSFILYQLELVNFTLRISVHVCIYQTWSNESQVYTVKILKTGTPEIITKIVLQLEQLDFTVQYCVQKMQTE